MHDRIEGQRIIIFDGVCNFCNGMVTFILGRERGPVFKFAASQTEAGKEILAGCGLPSDYSESVLLIEEGTVYFRSEAALRIGLTLRFPWQVLARACRLIPLQVRDQVYVQIATHRYQWYGKRDVCMVPTEELRSRFMGR